MRRLLEEVRAYPFHYGVPLAGAVALLILVVQAWSDAPAQPPRPSVTVAAAPSPAAEPAAEEPAGTLEDAAAKVDDGDYAGALVIAAALGKSQEGRIRREISRDLARRVNVALRAGDRWWARRLLARADRFPTTANIAAARVDYRAAKARAAARAERRRIARLAARRHAGDRRATRRAAREAERRAEEAAAAPSVEDGGRYAGKTCTEIGHSFKVTPGSDPDHDQDNDGGACEGE